MAVITISRQSGSGGDAIAAQLCKRLGFAYFDKRLMAQVAHEAGLSKQEIVDYSDDSYKVRSFLERLVGRRRDSFMADEIGSWADEGIGIMTKEVTAWDEVRSINLVQDTILAAYKHDRVVIVGRGGQAILKDKPGVLHVRVEAPMPLRVERIRAHQQIDLESAEEMLSERDRAAAHYLKRFYHIEWAEPLLYDLVINTKQLGIEAAANLIVSAVGYLSPGSA